MNRFLAISFPMVASACGFAGGDEALSPFPSDGVGTFQDASPIEVCLGTARIIAPSLATGAAALCVPTVQALRACTGISECTGIEKCICGRCIVEPCQGGSACTESEVCRGKRCTLGCTVDSDCPSKERCISGGCARTCKTSTDCHYGERCDSLDDVCVVSLCGNGATCGAAAHCEAVAEIAELHEPTYLGQESMAWIELDRGGTNSIYRAEISTPNVWRIEPLQPVFEMPGEPITKAPSVLQRGTTLDLYIAVGSPSRIVRARSTDNSASFVLDQDPVLVAKEPWENGAVGSPSVIEFQDATYLFYEGGERAGIGIAKITDTGATRLSTNPILSPDIVEDPIFWRKMTNVGAPHALVEGNLVRITFTGRGIEGFSATTGNNDLPPESNDSIGLASTNDLQSFALFPIGPMFTRLVNLRAYLGESEASLRIWPNGSEMVFVSSGASGEANTGLMRVEGRGGKD